VNYAVTVIAFYAVAYLLSILVIKRVVPLGRNSQRFVGAWIILGLLTLLTSLFLALSAMFLVLLDVFAAAGFTGVVLLLVLSLIVVGMGLKVRRDLTRK
jgi:hypothetical protein